MSTFCEAEPARRRVDMTLPEEPWRRLRLYARMKGVSYTAAAQEACILGLPIVERRALAQHPHSADVQQQLDRLCEHVDFLIRFMRAVARVAFGQEMLLAHWAAMGNKGRVDEDSILAELRAQARKAVDDFIADSERLGHRPRVEEDEP
jgi:hypothetical protein